MSIMEIQVNEQWICQVISGTYHLTLQVFNPAGDLLEQYSEHAEDDRLLFTISDCQELLFPLIRETQKPQIVSSEFNQIWAGIPMINEDQIVRIIVLGPVFTSGPSKMMIVNYAHDYDVKGQPRGQLSRALNNSPVCPHEELARVISLIYAFLYHDSPDYSAQSIIGLVKGTRTLPGEVAPAVEKPQDIDMLFRQTDEFEKQLLGYIREGNLDKLKMLLRTARYDHIVQIPHADPIRQHKNFFIILATLARYAAEEGGLNPEIAHSLVNQYLQRVEAMRDLLPIITISREMLYDFSERVKKQQHTRQYSKMVKHCCDYIDAHVQDALWASQVANLTGFNDHYISGMFKRETGQTIKGYIRTAKINEAKTLLKYSQLSLVEISEHLSFSSQSHFTALFKQATGKTPKQYREELGVF